MTNPFQFYSREWIEKSRSPIVHVICANQMHQFIEDQGYNPLTDDEWENLPEAFADTLDKEYLDKVLLTLRPSHREVVQSS